MNVGLATIGGMLVAGIASAPLPSIDADVDLTDGVGPPVVVYKLRDAILTAVVARAENGSAIGVFRAQIAPADPLRTALARIPRTVGGAPPPVDSATARFVVRSETGERTLLVQRPVTDPLLRQVLTELQKRSAAMRTTPALALKLEIRPANRSKATVRVIAEGGAGAVARIDPSTVLIEAAAEPARPAPGITPLPPEWQVVSEPPRSEGSLWVRAGEHLDLPISVTLAPHGDVWVRAVLRGAVNLLAPDPMGDVSIELSSAAIPVGSKKHAGDQGRRNENR